MFYSWQSDLPDATNRQAIRAATRDAASKIEAESNVDLNIVIDEATRNEPGSPNIPQTILEKISNSDVFICDITTINGDQSETRKTPNPNVMYELGYAVALLGWGRIILLFNTEFGSFPDDTPFDIDRHRASPYSLKFEADKKTTLKKIGPLASLQKIALTAIIKSAPPKPSEVDNLSPEEKKRKRDVLNLKSVLSTIHFPTLDEHITNLPRSIDNRIFPFWQSFQSIVSNSLFHLYDEDVYEIIKSLYGAWDSSLSYSLYYHSVEGIHNIFSNPMDAPLSDNQQQIWDEIHIAANDLNLAKNQLLDKVRSDYLEIDIEECSRISWNEYVKILNI